MNIQDGTAKFQTRTKVSKEEVCIRKGDILKIDKGTLWLTGTVTEIGTTILFNIPVNKVIVAANVRCKSLYARIRQNNSYLIGNPTTYQSVSPSWIHITPCGLHVSFSYPNKLTEINNDVVGVEIYGELEFY